MWISWETGTVGDEGVRLIQAYIKALGFSAQVPTFRRIRDSLAPHGHLRRARIVSFYVPTKGYHRFGFAGAKNRS